jgi:hypothetical protein
MAEQSQIPGDATPEQLSQALAEQRAALGQDALLIRENLNLKKKLDHSVQGSPRVWMGAAIGTGLLLGVAVPRLAAAIGSALVPKRKPAKGKSVSKVVEEENQKAATKGAAIGTLAGSFGSLILGIVRPIAINFIRDQIELKLRGGPSQKQAQR